MRKFKRSKSDHTLKIGARHSKETKSHLAAIKDCLDQMSQNNQEAADHLDTLLNGDDGDQDSANRSVSTEIQKIPGGSRFGQRTGEHNRMLETNDKAQLEKAHANSASALAKLAEVEQEVAGLRSEMESNNREIQQSLSNLLSLVEKLVAPQEAGARVARTGLPTHTVTKEDDSRPALAKSAGSGEASVHDLLKRTLQKPQPASVYLR